MSNQLLIVRGTLDPSQFWPQGKSDADTAHVLVEAVYWKSTNTKLLERAVHGKITRPALRNGKVTVRLQGLDAPELHYRPTALVPVKSQSEASRESFLRWNFDFRQYAAEQSVLALGELLKTSKRDPIPCWIETFVPSIEEAFDCYGRLVGDLWVNIKGKKTNLNRWLLRKGWAFPAFHDSMSAVEIRAIIKDVTQARSKNLGLWKNYSNFISALNWGLRYRPEPAQEEPQKVILPKVFRRLVNSSVNHRAGFFHGNFRQYLKVTGDASYLTDDFLKHGSEAKRYTLEGLLLPRGRMEVEPHQLVFIESNSRVSLR